MLFVRFLTQRGDNLTHLRLNSCKFLNASCIETVGIVCDNLTGKFVIEISTNLINLCRTESAQLRHRSTTAELLLSGQSQEPGATRSLPNGLRNRTVTEHARKQSQAEALKPG